MLLDYLAALQALPEGQEQQQRLRGVAEALLQVASAVCSRYQQQQDSLSAALLLEAVLAELAPVLPRDLPELVGAAARRCCRCCSLAGGRWPAGAAS